MDCIRAILNAFSVSRLKPSDWRRGRSSPSRQKQRTAHKPVDEAQILQLQNQLGNPLLADCTPVPHPPPFRDFRPQPSAKSWPQSRYWVVSLVESHAARRRQRRQRLHHHLQPQQQQQQQKQQNDGAMDWVSKASPDAMDDDWDVPDAANPCQLANFETAPAFRSLQNMVNDAGVMGANLARLPPRRVFGVSSPNTDGPSKPAIELQLSKMYTHDKTIVRVRCRNASPSKPPLTSPKPLPTIQLSNGARVRLNDYAEQLLSGRGLSIYMQRPRPSTPHDADDSDDSDDDHDDDNNNDDNDNYDGVGSSANSRLLDPVSSPASLSPLRRSAHPAAETSVAAAPLLDLHFLRLKCDYRPSMSSMDGFARSGYQYAGMVYSSKAAANVLHDMTRLLGIRANWSPGRFLVFILRHPQIRQLEGLTPTTRATMRRCNAILWYGIDRMLHGLGEPKDNVDLVRQWLDSNSANRPGLEGYFTPLCPLFTQRKRLSSLLLAHQRQRDRELAWQRDSSFLQYAYTPGTVQHNTDGVNVPRRADGFIVGSARTYPLYLYRRRRPVRLAHAVTIE